MRQRTLNRRDFVSTSALAVGAAFVSREGWAQGQTPVGDPLTYTEHQDLLYYLDADGKRQAVTTAAQWESRRAHVLRNMQVVMGPVPSRDQIVPLDVKVLETVTDPDFTRKKVEYKTEAGTAVRAWLFSPAKASSKSAAVLCLHQTIGIGKDEPAGLGGNPNLHYALHLARRGFVTLAPDYPSFGEYKYDFSDTRFRSGTMKAIWDNMRAVDLLQSLPEVDGQRIGVIGHSLGGHNSMFTAAFEPRIKAIVSNCGFTRFHKYYSGALKGWTSPRYMPVINNVYGNDPNKVPFDFPEIIGSFAPRPFLASSPTRDDNFEVSGVKDCIASARPVYELFGKAGALQAQYPESAHDFPLEAREVAYSFLEQALSRPM